MFQKINDDLKQAMKARDAFKLSVLRMMKAKLMTVDPRGNIAEKDAVKILTTYAKSLKEAMELAEQGGRRDVVEQTQKEVALIESYLPKQLSEEEVGKIVEETIARLQVSSKRQMGLVMKEIMANVQGVDGAIVKKLVEEKLPA